MDRSSAVVYVRSLKIGDLELGLAKVAGRHLIEYVLDSLPDDVEEVVIAVEDGGDVDAYEVVAEKYLARTTSSERMTGDARRFVEFAVNEVEGDKLVILPGDAPLITKDFTSFLLECSRRFTAALPRSPSRQALYLMASYQVKPFREAFRAHPDEDMDGIVRRVGRALYLSSSSLKIFDEKLGMFFRVSTFEDLKRAERILKMRGNG